MPHLNVKVACDPWCMLAEPIVVGYITTIVYFVNGTTKTEEIEKVAMANQKNRGQHIQFYKRQIISCKST